MDATKSIFEEFNQEREAAERVKWKHPILVIIGNPPYNGFAGIAIDEERTLSVNYRGTPNVPGGLKPQGQGLNDLYVRFFRMAERSILRELSGGEAAEGIVCFISNYSWLDGMSFPLMREKYLDSFDSIWIDSLNGDKYKTGKLTPDGASDPSAFSTAQNREGIQVGTAIATMVRKAKHKSPAKVYYRDFWGAGKLKDLLAFGRKWAKRKYAQVEPIRELGLPFRPMTTTAGYTAWPIVPDLFPSYFTGVKTSRDDVLVEIDRPELESRMESYFDKSISDVEMRSVAPRLMANAARFDAIETRKSLLHRGYLPNNIVRFAYRPFDLRWLYWEPDTKLLDEKRTDYFPHVFPGNSWFAAVQQNRKEFDPPSALQQLASLHIIERGANIFPMLLKEDTNGHTLFGGDTGRQCHDFGDHCANLSDIAVDYLSGRGNVIATPSLFFHCLAMLHAPSYAIENADALRQDWPRVPLPNDAKLLKNSGELGLNLAALLDAQKHVPGVTSGKRRKEFGIIGDTIVFTADLAVTAHWGIAGKGGICMPSKGKAVERAYTPEELAAIGDGVAQLGETTFDIFLNDAAYWKNVPKAVWEYTLGGYQVLKKWLSYREFALLGRALRLDEVEYFQQVIRRIAALRLLGPALDANYEAVKADLFNWPK